MRSLVEEGAEEERILWGEANLRKAKAKVAEKQAAIEGFDGAVRQSERELAAVVARVKDEGVDEVVEVDVHGEMEEASVKEEEEETKVVEAAPAGGGGTSGWLRGLMGSRAAGALLDLPWDPPVLGGPHPPNLDTRLLVAPESPVWTLRFLLVRVHHRLLGAGRWVWVDGGGLSTWTSPCAWGWSRGCGGGNVSCRRRGISGAGRWPPPPERGVKMFELAQTNIFTPDRKNGGGHPLAIRRPLLARAGLGGGVERVGKAWVWTPTRSALLDFGGLNPEAANRGVYAGVVHGIATRPKPKPKPAAAPAGGPPQPHPPNPADAFAKALGAISPALDRQGTVCRLRSGGDVANRSSANLATAMLPPLERR